MTRHPAQGHALGAVGAAARAVAESAGTRSTTAQPPPRHPKPHRRRPASPRHGRKAGRKLDGPARQGREDQLDLPGRRAFRLERRQGGKDQSFAGKSSYENGILTLVQDQNNNTMVGNVHWTDEEPFHVQGHRRPTQRSRSIVLQSLRLIAGAMFAVIIAHAYQSIRPGCGRSRAAVDLRRLTGNRADASTRRTNRGRLTAVC